MIARDALGVACVLFPSLRVPVALVDVVSGVAASLRLDEGGQVWHRGRWLIFASTDGGWGLGAWVAPVLTGGPIEQGSVILGPLSVNVSRLPDPDELLAPTWGEVA